MKIRHLSKLYTFLLTLFALSLYSNFIVAQNYWSSPRVRQSLGYNSDKLNQQALKLKQALYYIYNGYVDSTELSHLTEVAIKKMIQELDPHSAYISAEDLKAMEEPLRGNFDGIGIEYSIIADTLTVQGVIPDGPSEKVGLKAGDKINSVNGEVISGTKLTTSRVMNYLRGKRGTKVKIGYIRRNSPEREVVIVRDRIPINTVDCSYQIEDGVLYLRINRFGSETYNEMMYAVKSFRAKHELKGMIVDLRGNGGGYLSAAQEIANEFLGKGELILYSEGRSIKRVDNYADGSGKLQKVPLVVVIDEGSASASEIVAGAIQDWDRGTIVGRRSFGKGLVQQEFPLQDGSAIRVTIARYHTPSGRVIQSPYTEGNASEYYNNVLMRALSDERFNPDSVKINDSLKFKTLKLGRIVYGGGGIIPDIFVPIDTSYYSESYIKCLSSGNMVEFVSRYSDLNREKFENIYGDIAASESAKDLSFNKFNNEFKIDRALMREFLTYCESHDNKFSESDLTISESEIKKNLKGLIIRNLYGLDYYIRYLNIYDQEILKAVEAIKIGVN